MSPSAVLDRIMEHHDYVWARLPFVPAMAIAIARRRRDSSTDELARLVIELQGMVLDHLAREERSLAGQDRAGDQLHADHVSIGLMLGRIHALAASCQCSAEPAITDLERAFRNELALLYEHVTSQIGLEEALAERADEHDN